MQLSVTGRHVDVSDSMRRYAEDKAGKLPRFFDRIESIEVIFEQEAMQHCVELVVRSDHKDTFVAKEAKGDFYEAIDLVCDKMGRQLTKHKEKLRNRKHPGQQSSGPDKTIAP